MSGKQDKRQRQALPKPNGRDWSALDVLMLRDDMEWVSALGVSSRISPQWQSAMGLTLLPQMARVVHEGMSLLRQKRPVQAKAVNQKFAAEIDASRHSVKLLDDTHKLYDGVITDFERIGAEHSAVFPEESSFAVTELHGRLVTTTRLAAFQQATSLADRALLLPPTQRYSRRLGVDIGRALPTILKQFGFAFPAPNNGLTFLLPAPQVRTVNPSVYFAERFDSQMPQALMDVLTAIESTTNSALYVFDPSAGDYPNPLFRCRFVTVTHALNALDEISTHHQFVPASDHVKEVRTLIGSPAAIRLRGLRALRNRSMHYGIPRNLDGLGANLPGYGLVEATSDTTYEEVQEDTIDLLESISDLLYGWRRM